MTLQIILLLCVLTTLALFAWKRLLAEVVALGVLLAFVFTGIG